MDLVEGRLYRFGSAFGEGPFVWDARCRKLWPVWSGYGCPREVLLVADDGSISSTSGPYGEGVADLVEWRG